MKNATLNLQRSISRAQVETKTMIASFFTGLGRGVGPLILRRRCESARFMFVPPAMVTRTVVSNSSLSTSSPLHVLTKTPRLSNRSVGRRPLSMDAKKSDVSKAKAPEKTMWERFLAPKPMPERYTTAWYGEILLICTVFGITGTTTMMVSPGDYRAPCF